MLSSKKYWLFLEYTICSVFGIFMISSCQSESLREEQLIDDSKWFMYCLNFQYCGIEIDSFNGPFYTPITCDLKYDQSDTITKDTVVLYFSFSSNNKQIVIVDTLNKTKTSHVYYPSRFNTVMGIVVINNKIMYPRFANNLTAIREDSNYHKEMINYVDSLEKEFLSYGKLHINDMCPWLKNEYSNRVNGH